MKTGKIATLSIPDHSEVKRVVIAKLLAAADISEETYLKAFK